MKPRTCRRLAPGEPLPEGTPRRFTTSGGYVLLRWKVGVCEYVEAPEHRAVMGNPVGHVHHINHDKADNRPENLEVLTPEEHSQRHGAERRIDGDEAERLYATGMTTLAVGEALGCNASAVYRTLTARGVEIRPPSYYLTAKIDDDLLTSLVAAGVPARRIAAAMGLSDSTIGNRIKALGLPPRRGGRTTDEEAARAEAALAAIL